MSSTNYDNNKIIDDLFAVDTEDKFDDNYWKQFNNIDESELEKTIEALDSERIRMIESAKSIFAANQFQNIEKNAKGDLGLTSACENEVELINNSSTTANLELPYLFDLPFIQMAELCADISRQNGAVKHLIEMAKMTALCRVDKQLLRQKVSDKRVKVEGIDLLVALIGNTGVEQGIRAHYQISTKLLPYPPQLIQYRALVLSPISNINYEIFASGDISDWQHLQQQEKLVSFDMDRCYNLLSELIKTDAMTGAVVLNSSINLTAVVNSSFDNGSISEYKNFLLQFEFALANKPSEIEIYRKKHDLEKSLNLQVINNEHNIKECLNHSLQNTNSNKVKSVMTFIGPAESGRSTLAQALFNATNQLNNTLTELITIDCAQYVHENCVGHFTGIEPFYRTPRQGFLTYKVEQNPYSVILFKNLNNAHKSLQNLVQNLIQNGYLDDITTERKISFEHTQIIISLEDKSPVHQTKSKLTLSGDALLSDKTLGLEASLAASLCSNPIIKTERLQGMDTYELCRRRLEDVTHQVNLPLLVTPYLPALTLIGCGKNDLPSAIEQSISKLFEALKSANYQYIIENNIQVQPQVEMVASMLPKQCAIVGMNKNIKGQSGVKLRYFTVEKIVSDREQLLDFRLIVIAQKDKSIFNLLRAMPLHKDCLIAYVGEKDTLENNLQDIVDGYIPLNFMKHAAQFCERIMALYAVKCQQRYKRRQTAVTLSSTLTAQDNNSTLLIDFDSHAEDVRFDPEIFNKSYFSVAQPKERLDDVIGYEDVKAQLRDVIVKLNNTKSNSNPPPKGLIFEGPPGTGKTFLALAMAGESELNVITANASDLMSGEGVKNINSLIDAAESVAPSIIFIDEFDAIGRKRDEQSVGYAAIVNALLTRMDGTAKPETPVLFVAATNYAEKLDPALLRAGRFDVSIRFSLPNLQERINAIELYAAKKRILTNPQKTSLLAIMCEGLTHKAIENKIIGTAYDIEKAQGNKREPIQMCEVIDEVFPIPVATEKYDPKLEYRLTIQAYRLAAKLMMNELIYSDITHYYANIWHSCYFYEALASENISYRYFCNELKKHLCERAAEALYLGNDKEATMFTAEGNKHIMGLARTALNALNISERDFIDEFPHYQSGNNADSALVRKMYKEVKAELSENWQVLEGLVSAFIETGYLNETDISERLNKNVLASFPKVH